MKANKRIFLLSLLAFLSASYCSAYNKKPLYTVLESTGNGIVYMTDDKYYMNGDHTNTTSKAGKFSELRTIFSSSQEEYDSLKCYLYFHVKADPGYGLVGFTETKHEDNTYQDEDFVLDINGNKAVSGSCIDVDDPNWPCIDDKSYDYDDEKYYSKTPNKHYYAIFTEVPDFRIEDGVDMAPIQESPTGTHTVIYTRHLKAGWNSIYLPCEFDVEKFKATIKGSDVYMLMAYIKSANSIIYGIGMKQVPRCTPMAVYSPVDYDLEYIGANHTATTNDVVSDSHVTIVGANYHFAGTFKNTEFDGKCYKVSTSANGNVQLAEADNDIPAFQFALVFDDDKSTPASKCITFATGRDDTDVIPTLKSHKVAFDGIFSLDGRQLYTEPSKGIYIKNGRKAVK